MKTKALNMIGNNQNLKCNQTDLSPIKLFCKIKLKFLKSFKLKQKFKKKIIINSNFLENNSFFKKKKLE
jgi:hypothetical protein